MKLTHDEDRLFEVLMDIKERFPRVKRLDWIIPSVKFYLSTVPLDTVPTIGVV